MKDIDDTAVEIAVAIVSSGYSIRFNKHIVAENAYNIAEALIEEGKRRNRPKKVTKLPSMAKCINLGHKFITLDVSYYIHGYYKDRNVGNFEEVVDIEKALEKGLYEALKLIKP
mgnify:CR=1 FL=1